MKKQGTDLPTGNNTAAANRETPNYARWVAIPPIPLISDHSNRQVGRRDTLERVICVIELLAEMDYGKGLSSKAETGLYWVQMMMIESLNYISQALAAEKRE